MITKDKDGTRVEFRKEYPKGYDDTFRLMTSDKFELDDEVIVVVKRLEEE